MLSSMSDLFCGFLKLDLFGKYFFFFFPPADLLPSDISACEKQKAMGTENGTGMWSGGLGLYHYIAAMQSRSQHKNVSLC